MKKDHVFVGLDLGSSAIRIAAGQSVQSPDKRDGFHVLGIAEVPSQGISKGNITSLEDAVSAISACMEQAERQIGLPISEATVGVNGTFVSMHLAKGIIGVSRPEGDIRSEDVDRAIESARATINPANQEILHILPRSFMVDGQTGIKDPVGMQGIRLEVDTHIVQGLSTNIRNVTQAVYRTGLEVTELVYAPLALAELLTTRRQRDVGVCVACIGASTTGLAVYENGELLAAVTIPIGADHITSDVAIGLRVSLDTAEQIKCSCGTAAAEHLPKRGDEIDVAAFGGEESEIVPLRFVAEIIQARVEELFEKIDQELKRIDRQGMLPAGLLLTGGGAKLPGMVEVAKRILRLPCAMAQTRLQSSMPELVDDPRMSTAIALASWAFENERRETSSPRPFRGAGRSREIFSKLSKPFSKLFKSFLP